MIKVPAAFSEWPVVVISLNDAHHRRAALEKSLSEIEVCYEVFPAVDGRWGLEEKYENLIDRAAAQSRLGREMTDPEFGCALSHLSVYEILLAEGWPGAIVLEDDAIVGSLFKEFVSSKAYLSYGFVQLDYNWARVWRFGYGTSRVTQRIVLRRLIYNAGCAVGYAISSAAASFILNCSRPVSMIADWPCDLAPIRPYVTDPQVVRHRPKDDKDSYLAGGRKESIAKAKMLKLTKGGSCRNPKPRHYNCFGRFFSYFLPNQGSS